MVTRADAALSVVHDIQFLLGRAGPPNENALMDWAAAHSDEELARLLDGMAAMISLLSPLYKTLEVKWLERMAAQGKAFTALIEKVAAEGVDVSSITAIQANALKESSPSQNGQRSGQGG